MYRVAFSAVVCSLCVTLCYALFSFTQNKVSFSYPHLTVRLRNRPWALTVSSRTPVSRVRVRVCNVLYAGPRSTGALTEAPAHREHPLQHFFRLIFSVPIGPRPQRGP